MAVLYPLKLIQKGIQKALSGSDLHAKCWFGYQSSHQGTSILAILPKAQQAAQRYPIWEPINSNAVWYRNMMDITDELRHLLFAYAGTEDFNYRAAIETRFSFLQTNEWWRYPATNYWPDEVRLSLVSLKLCAVLDLANQLNISFSDSFYSQIASVVADIMRLQQIGGDGGLYNDIRSCGWTVTNNKCGNNIRQWGNAAAMAYGVLTNDMSAILWAFSPSFGNPFPLIEQLNSLIGVFDSGPYSDPEKDSLLLPDESRGSKARSDSGDFSGTGYAIYALQALTTSLDILSATHGLGLTYNFYSKLTNSVKHYLWRLSSSENYPPETDKVHYGSGTDDVLSLNYAKFISLYLFLDGEAKELFNQVNLKDSGFYPPSRPFYDQHLHGMCMELMI